MMTVVASSPLALARAALERGHRPGVALEVYAQFGRTLSIKAFGGEVESVASAEPRGLGIRALLGEKRGYAYTGDLSATGLDLVLAEAVANARAADPDPFVALPGKAAAYPLVAGLWRRGLSRTALADKVRLVLEAEAAALGEPEIEAVEETTYAESEARVAIVSSEGVEAQMEQTFCYLYLLAHARRGTELESGQGFSAGREPADLDAVSAGQEAAGKARVLLGAEPCPTATRTVVFDREVAAALLATISAAFGADAVQKGRSVFAPLLGEVVASPLLSLSDDGLATGGMGSAPFDGEGVAQQSTSLISGGILTSFLHNTYTARKQGAGAVSSGNASRSSYRALPGVGPTNLVLAPGRGSLDDLLARVGEGLYVESISGLHSGVNPVSGEISVGVTGRLIERGVAGRPVREVTIATDFLTFLKGVVDIAADSRWIPLFGSALCPSFAVEGVAVSGA